MGLAVMEQGLSLMNWDLALSVLTIVVAICGAAVGAVWMLTSRMSKDRNDLTQAITAMNNALLTRLQMTEERLDQKLSDTAARSDVRALEIERDVAQFKTYCERQFLSKETFQTVMQAQSSERSAMRGELIDRFNRIERRLDDDRRERDG